MGTSITIWSLYQSSDEELDPGNVTSSLDNSTTTEAVSEVTSDLGTVGVFQLIS